MINMDKKGGSSIEGDLLEKFALDGLTQRETEVLTWATRGKTNKEIGIIFNISPRTASKHLQNIYIKWGVESRVGAVVRFVEIIEQAGKLDKTG